MLVQANIGPHKSAHVIVVGNEKGGSGKSTTAMHLITALARAAAPMTADPARSAVTLPIGNKTLTLTNGRLIGGNSPELKQALLSETLKFQFKTLSIA